jgi:hypothetical protein
MIPKRNVTPIREKFSTKLHTMPEIVFCFKVDKFSSASNQCSGERVSPYILTFWPVAEE